MADEYSIEYGSIRINLHPALKSISDESVKNDPNMAVETIPMYLDKDGRKHYLGALAKSHVDENDEEVPIWMFHPVKPLVQSGEIETNQIYNRDVDMLKEDVERKLRSAGVLALIDGGDMADNYFIEYGVATNVKHNPVPDMQIHDKTVQKIVIIPVYLNEGGEFGERKYFVGTIEKQWYFPDNPIHEGWDVKWQFNPVPQLQNNDGIPATYDRELDLLKNDIERELRDAGVLALGGGEKYDPKTGVGAKKPARKKPRQRKGPKCTNEFINGDQCTRPVAKKFVKMDKAFHLCEECAEELGIA